MISANAAISGSYDYGLVALSVLMAVSASYVALDLAGRVTAATGWSRAAWLICGAGAMGLSIFSMHFIGMLAFHLPLPVAYHRSTVLMSLLAAILSSAFALYVMSQQKIGLVRAFAGSVIMGGGIAAMHFIGMAAMRLSAVCRFDPLLVTLSVVLAIMFSLGSLLLAFDRRAETRGAALRKLASAVVMGAAVSAMHYTGMASASFVPSTVLPDLSHAVSISSLGTAAIAAVTFIALGLAVLMGAIDRRLAVQAKGLEYRVAERTRELRAVNQQLRNEIAEHQRAEDALRKAQTELAHVTRVLAMGELVASIAHEVNQPLSGVVINGNSCLRWLAGDSPNLGEVRETVQRIIRDGKRASDVIARIRALTKKTVLEKERLGMNEVIQEVVALVQSEVRRNRVALRTELTTDLPPVLGDRVQLQQVVLNLVMNGIDAMSTVGDRLRALIIRTQIAEGDQIRVTVQDSGTGLDPQNLERVFDAFYTTKPEGMGMGLSISRSIVSNHGGRLWATANDIPGTSFQFTIPAYQQESSQDRVN